jgi:hypothetical protein
VSDGDETMPPTSGVVEGELRVIVCSRRVGLMGSGSAIVVRDVADLLMAIEDHVRTAVIVDSAHTPIELAFLARLARDFPPSVAILVQGDPAVDRRAFHDQGVYRPSFDPRDEGVLPDREGILDQSELVARVIEALERHPTPLVSLNRS